VLPVPVAAKGNRGRRDGLHQLSGWRIQWRVVDALTYRELRTRVSNVRGGFLGVLMQPLGLIMIWTAFLTVLSAHRGGSMNVVLFLTSGIILYTTFSQIVSRSANGMEANEGLLFYRPVKPIDTVISRTLCELGLYTCCLIVLIVGTWLYLDQIVMNDIGLFFVTLLLAAMLGFSTGLLCLVASHNIPGFSQFYPWIPRALWFFSGVPFRYWIFPPWTRVFFVWNPLCHCIELNRQAITADYFTPDANLGYAVGFTIVLTTIALAVYSNNERKLLTL
jgi:capsular polysaccharide transport system permease protein